MRTYAGRWMVIAGSGSAEPVPSGISCTQVPSATHYLSSFVTIQIVNQFNNPLITPLAVKLVFTDGVIGHGYTLSTSDFFNAYPAGETNADIGIGNATVGDVLTSNTGDIFQKWMTDDRGRIHMHLETSPVPGAVHPRIGLIKTDDQIVYAAVINQLSDPAP